MHLLNSHSSSVSCCGLQGLGTAKRSLRMLGLAAVLALFASSCSKSSSADWQGLPEASANDSVIATADSVIATADSGGRVGIKPPVLLPAVESTALLEASPLPTHTIPVTLKGVGATPDGGHPPAPQAGMIPREHPYWNQPNCVSGPPWASDCYPPAEWEMSQDLSNCFAPYPGLGAGGICASGPTDELPRWTTEMIDWASWCYEQPRGNCTWLLYEMKWALDYLGAHPWCVLNEYQDRADAYGAGARGKQVQNRHGWHNCASVIDPLATDPPAGRFNDSGLLLSDTTSLAEQCRIVLPADVELETLTSLFGDQPSQSFGSDCDAWAIWVENRPKGRERRDCDRSARLAEEWMEHHHATPERYFIVYC